jgi:hypothetical protein
MTLFRNDSPGALTLEEAIEIEMDIHSVLDTRVR